VVAYIEIRDGGSGDIFEGIPGQCKTPPRVSIRGQINLK
jgi:hypothetical protein